MRNLVFEKCIFCGNETLVERINGKFICKDCFDKNCLYAAGLEGYKLWMQTINYSSAYDSGVDDAINIEIGKEEFKKGDIQHHKEKILEMLKQNIVARLEFYHKDEIFAALLAIKECIRRNLIRKKKCDWLIISDLSAVNLLMKFASEITEYENHPIAELEDECSYFANAISYARRYNMIEENIVLTYEKNIQIEDICFEPIQTEESEKYFEVYLKNGLEEKPEDYIIQNKALQERLEAQNKTPEKLLQSLDELLSNEFGFSSEECMMPTQSFVRMEYTEEKYWDFINGKSDLFEHMPIFVMEKTLLEEIYGAACFEAMLNTFSINEKPNPPAMLGRTE